MDRVEVVEAEEEIEGEAAARPARCGPWPAKKMWWLTAWTLLVARSRDGLRFDGSALCQRGNAATAAAGHPPPKFNAVAALRWPRCDVVQK